MAKATTNGARLITREFVKEKDTKNKVKFQEDYSAGEPEISGTQYLAKWFVKEGQRVRATFEVID
jgi:hypothetical protein